MTFKISKVYIKGFRKIQEPLTLDWIAPNGQPLNQVIIAGPNGWGKTSLLEAIVLGLCQDQLLVRDLPASDRDEHWRQEVPEGAEIQITLHKTGPNQVKLDANPPVVAGLAEDLESLKEFKIVRNHENIYLEYAGSPYNPKTQSETQSLWARIGAFFRRIGLIEYFSSWRSPTLVGALKPAMSGAKLKDTEANRLRRFKQHVIDQRARKAFIKKQNIENIDELWLEKLNSAWAKFHGNDGSHIDADIVDSESEETFFDLFIFDKPRIRRCTLDQVSSGEIELVTILGTLIQKDFHGIFIIDEPELHMHPQWQSGLLRALREVIPDSQIIMATHADAPWDQALSFERFFLSSPSDPRYKINAQQDINKNNPVISWDDE